MDGSYAKLDKIVPLAKKYDTPIMIDDCHATGFVGKNGKGTAEHFGLEGEVDILTGTLGKALGGAEPVYVPKVKSLSYLNKDLGHIYSQCITSFNCCS